MAQERLDFRAALVCATLANIHRDPKKQSYPFSPQDFMPQRCRVHKRQTVQQQVKLAEAWNAALGGRDERPTEVR